MTYYAIELATQDKEAFSRTVSLRETWNFGNAQQEALKLKNAWEDVAAAAASQDPDAVHQAALKHHIDPNEARRVQGGVYGTQNTQFDIIISAHEKADLLVEKPLPGYINRTISSEDISQAPYNKSPTTNVQYTAYENVNIAPLLPTAKL